MTIASACNDAAAVKDLVLFMPSLGKTAAGGCSQESMARTAGRIVSSMVLEAFHSTTHSSWGARGSLFSYKEVPKIVGQSSLYRYMAMILTPAREL